MIFELFLHQKATVLTTNDLYLFKQSFKTITGQLFMQNKSDSKISVAHKYKQIRKNRCTHGVKHIWLLCLVPTCKNNQLEGFKSGGNLHYQTDRDPWNFKALHSVGSAF